MTQEAPPDIQLGELLIRGGLVEPEQFEAAYRLSFKMRLPIGRVLTMHGHITEQQLRAAIEIQARIRDGLLPFEHAIQALIMVSNDGVALDTALNRSGPVAQSMPKEIPTHNRLGELLIQSGIASPPLVEQGLVASAETGLPLGTVLLNKGIITRAALNSALAAQRLLREGRVDRDQLLYALKMARIRSISLEQSLRENAKIDASLTPSFGLGELFVMAGAVSESQLLTASEVELTTDRTLDDIFVELGYCSKPCVKAARHILKMIADGILFEDQAAQIIQKIQFARSNDELQRVLAMIDSDPDAIFEEREPIEITDILKKAGLISDKDLQIATALALANKVPLMKTLFDARLIDEMVLEHATHLKTYLDADLLKLEQATIVMAYCLENNMTVEETLDTFGWTAPQ